MSTYILEFKRPDESPDFYAFDTPVKYGDENYSVEMLKLYFGLTQAPGEGNGIFDKELRNRLRSWQDENHNHIMQVISDQREQNDEQNILNIGTFSEQGEVGDVTFKVLMEKGFHRAAKELLESRYYDSNSGTGDNPTQAYPSAKRETQTRPYYEGEFVKYHYITKYTDRDFSEQGIYGDWEVLGTAFRLAVNKVFEFYDKPKVWTVSGAPAPDAPIVAGLYGDPKKVRSEYNKIVNQRNELLPSDAEKITFDNDDQEFRFTVNELTFEQQLNSPEYDVLFKQPLQPGSAPLFAAIEEINNPSLRPMSTYSIVIKIRKDLFGGIMGGTTFDIASPEPYVKAAQKYSDLKKSATRLYERAGKIKDDLTEPGVMNRQVDKFVKGQKRKAAKAAQQIGRDMWNQAKSGKGGLSEAEAKNRAQAAISDSQAARKSGPIGPKILKIRLNQLRDHIKKAADHIEGFHPDIETFKAENKPTNAGRSSYEKALLPIIPDLNPKDEARKLREIPNALDEFLQINGYSLDSAAPMDEKFLEIEFSAVEGVLNTNPLQDNSLAADPNKDTYTLSDEPPIPAGAFKTIVGFKIASVKYIDENDLGNRTGKKLSAGLGLFDRRNQAGARPLIYPTTMGYLSELETIIKHEIAENPCDDLDVGNPALAFFSEFHWPTLGFNFNKKISSGFNIDASISIESGRTTDSGGQKIHDIKNLVDLKDKSILSAMEEFKENKKILDKNMKAIQESMVFRNRSKVIETGDIYPDFGKISCDLEGIWDQFINQWKMEYVICDLQKCIPGLPTFNFSFNWTIPWFSWRFPIWDPMFFILPQIRISINDIILGFICKLIKNILETIKRPDCTDLIRFGLAVYSEMNEKNQDPEQNPFANAQERASTAEKAAATFANMGVTDYRVSGEEENFLDTVSMSLTPTEFCDLLRGRASDEVLGIVLRIVETTTEALKEHLQTYDEVEKFFATLGSVVDPFICDRIEELNDLIISQELCRNDQDLRSLLEDAGATEEQIRQEIEALDAKRKILNDLSKKGDFSALLPGMSPAELDAVGMPGPYSNSFHDGMLRRAISTVLSGIKSHYTIDISSFADKIIDKTTNLIEPGAAGFNLLDYLRFVYYSREVDLMAEEMPNNRNYRPKKIGEFKTTAAMELDSLGSSYIEMESLGIPADFRSEVQFLPVRGEPFSNLEDYVEKIEQYVTGYIERYTVVTLAVFQTLKKILENDASSVARKFPSLQNGFREFSIALFTTSLRQIPIDIAAATSVMPSRSMVAMTDKPFSDQNVKDCYTVMYSPGQGNFPIAKTYKEDVPEPYVNMRREHIDVSRAPHRARLLRPCGFTFFIISKYISLADNNPGANTFDLYADATDNIIPKLSGFISPYDPQIARDLFDQMNNSEDIEGLGGLLVSLILAALAAGSEMSNKVKSAPLYTSVVDGFNYHISQLIRESRFFDVENVLELESDASQDYKVREECYVKNEKSLDFDKFVKKFEDIFKRIASTDRHNPATRDFNLKGPFDEAILEVMIKIYVDIFSLDLMLKSIFMLSKVGAKNVLTSQFVMDYVTESVLGELTSYSVGSRSTAKLNNIAKSLTNMEDPNEAFRSLISRNLDLDEIQEFVNELYEPKHDSYKELIYNEMAENIKEIPSTDDYPKVTVLGNFGQEDNFVDYAEQFRPIEAAVIDGVTLPGRVTRDVATDYSSYSESFAGFVDKPVSAKFPNLYDKFAFKGYSERLIEKKINSGHFWIERFYKISDYERFREIYNEIESLSSRNSTFGRISRLSQEYSEFISATDLERILFGSVSTADVNEYVNDIEEVIAKNRVELDYTKNVILSLLSGFYYSRRSRSIPVKVMEDLGMADYVFESPNRPENEKITVQDRTGTSHYTTIVGNVGLGQGNFYRGTPWEDALLIVRPTPLSLPDVEIDLAFRRGKVTKQELYSRMTSRFQVAEKVINGELALDAPILAPWTTLVNDGHKNNPDFGQTANQYAFLGLYDGVTPNSERISLERKAELFVDCLTKFVEISHNWVTTSNDRLPVQGWLPKWRDLNEIEGSGFSERKDRILRTAAFSYPAMRKAQRIGNYHRRSAAFVAANLAAGAPIEDWPAAPELVYNYPFNVLAARLNGEADWTMSQAREILYSPGNEIQESILSRYISEIVTVTSAVSFSDSRAGVLNIPTNFDRSRIVSAEGRGIVSPIDDEALVATKQQDLYNHIRDNLQIGYRLMFGHSLIRTEEDFLGELDGTINPEDIFRDITGFNDEGLVNDGTIGIGDRTSLFSKKRAFLGHTDNSPILYTQAQNAGTAGSLNSDSVFYESAAAVMEEYQLAYEDFRVLPLVKPVTEKIKQKLVYSIPIDEVTQPIDCFGDLYMEYQRSQVTELRNRLSQNIDRIEELRASDDAGLLADARQNIEEKVKELENLELLLGATAQFSTQGNAQYLFISQRIEEVNADLGYLRQYERQVEAGQHDTAQTTWRVTSIERENEELDNILGNINGNFFEPFDQNERTRISPTPFYRRKFLREELFSKYNDRLLEDLLSLSARSEGKRKIKKSVNEADTLKPHRVMFDFLLPLDRYASLHFLQNLEVFEDNRGSQDMMKITKLCIIQNMLALEGLTNRTSDEDAPSDTAAVLNSSVGADVPSTDSFMVQLAEAIKAAAEAAATAAWRGLADASDPGYRDMRSGYKKDPCSMKSGLQHSLVGVKSIDKYSGDLNNGFGTRQGCKQYIPLNNMPGDIIEGTLKAATGSPGLLIKAVKHFKGTIENESSRYGYMFTPIGNIALGLKENAGEAHKKLKKDKSCEESCVTKPVEEEIQPAGKCEDE